MKNDILTNQQFSYWLHKMGLDANYNEAARLLKTDVSTILNYITGRFQVSRDHSNTCQFLLKAKSGDLAESRIGTKLQKWKKQDKKGETLCKI